MSINFLHGVRTLIHYVLINENLEVFSPRGMKSLYFFIFYDNFEVYFSAEILINFDFSYWSVLNIGIYLDAIA